MRIVVLLFTLIYCIKTRFISSSSLVNISHFLIILFNRKILGSKYVNMSVRMHTTNLSFSYFPLFLFFSYLSLSYSYLPLSLSFSYLYLPPSPSFLIVLNFISVTCENVYRSCILSISFVRHQYESASTFIRT